MKKYISFYLFLTSFCFLIFLSLFNSCSEDKGITNTQTQQTTIYGIWQVDKAQMVQAPAGGGISAIMKQALVTFGEMNSSDVGNCTVVLNQDSTWSLWGRITNAAIKIICSANDTGYTASGVFFTSGATITFNVQQYSGPFGNQTVGSGTYSLTTNLVINLNLANNEKWKITLRR